MNPTSAVARRFPLVARPRPAYTPLDARIAALNDLARQAEADNDLTAAARVLNQAALIASDCRQPDGLYLVPQHALAWLHDSSETLDPANAVTDWNPW